MKLKEYLTKIGQTRGGKIIIGVVMVGVIVRLLPYLAPVRAADIAQREQAIAFTDRTGLPLGTILTRNQEHTAVVPLDAISPHFRQAIIAAEDKRYYHHGSIDSLAVVRAILEAIQARQIVSGASTITMQLARMLQPNNHNNPLVGKLQEIWLSWRLTAGMNKNQILAAYINRLPMGGNIYGVEAASRAYFGMAAKDLNLARASILAAIPNDPNRLNPYYLWAPLKQRQKYVLDRMVADGYITAAEAETAYQEQIQIISPNQGIIAAPHFLFWLADQLPPEVSQVRTTINLPLQKFLETQVDQVVRALASHNANHAAALVLDNHTGEVLAYVGSPNYFSPLGGRNDGVQALRQPGSALKPFLYQLALERGIIRPHTILPDVPTHYAIPGAKLYSPQDYSETFLGPVRVRVALANSLNIPAVRVLEKVGVANFLDRLHQLGFEHLSHPPEHYGLGLTLGSGEVSLWELARAYLIMATGGEISQLQVTPIQWINSTDDALAKIRSPQPPLIRGVPQAGGSHPEVNTWALITDMLADSHARSAAFGVDSILNLPFPAAVKTGTSSDFRDTWTVGFTRDYTVATWVGNFNGDRMRQVSGVVGAAPLWHRIMVHLHQNQEPAPFDTPAELVQRPICATTGVKPGPECPAVVLEYFAPEDLAQWETPPKTSISSSPEYKDWLSRQQQPTLTAGTLNLVFPQKDDYFVIDPAATTSPLQFKLAAPSTTPVQWWLKGKDGEKLLATTTKADTLFWSMKPGDWILEVKSGNKTDMVKFQVVLGERQPTRRGFSLVGQPPSLEGN
ncbi:penicillin-binding protein 1C [[Phormidium] sp. ETS-05]|uniref:penicillin-binding protein 1C n=1 Tax=[Phormidium] sp. ETS-05 TaxID=222819 RepID=UPI0018EEF763|nr:penicillin-binding protein 1C [[Phormidium] sp. ETS-05]